MDDLEFKPDGEAGDRSTTAWTWPRRLRAIVAVVVATAIVVTQTDALAQDAMTSAGRGGESFGKAISPATLPTVDSSGNVTLFPGVSGTVQGSFQTEELFPGATGSLDSLKNAYSSGGPALNQAGADAYESLKAAATPEGQAVSVVRGSVKQSRPDLRNDPVFGSTDNVLSNIKNIAKDFSDCSVETKFESASIASHQPDLRTCERFNDLSGSCDLTHDYGAGIIQAADANTHVESCGAGCTDIWIGQIGNNYWSGTCQVFTLDGVLHIVNRAAITSATLEYVKWDDYVDVQINDNTVWSGPENPGPRPANCELGTEWEATPNVDLTSTFQNNASVRFRLAVTVGVKGEGYGRIRVHYDPAKVVAVNTLDPPECAKRAVTAADGFCAATYTCTDMPELDADGCAVVNGARICPSDVQEGLPKGFPPLCRQAKLETKCSFWEGTAQCWTDPQGVEHCPTVSGNPEPVDECKALENQGCGFISSACVDGAKGASGTCYVTEERWDCGSVVNVPTVTQQRTYDCKGPVRCQGTECIDVSNETNADFATAAAALNAARFMAMDNDCASQDPDIAAKCSVFKGKPQQCKKVFGSVVDCCNPKGATGVSLGDYITLAFAVGKADSAIMAMDSTSALRGAWETLRQPAVDAWSTVSDPIVSSWNSIWDGYSGVCKAAACWDGAGHLTMGDTVSEGFLHGIEQGIMKETQSFVTDTFGEEASSLLFKTTESGDVVLGGVIGGALSTIMLAYTIYQVVMILIKLIWQCTQDEFELNVNKQLKNCHYVGSYCASKALTCIEKRESYCCFNSPLSRIIQEQARPQLGRDFGTPKSPECGGLSVDDMQAIDWSKVDLSEWVGILSSTGHLPDPSAITSDSLTKNNFFQDSSGTRRNVETRTTDRLNGIDGTAVRDEASKQYRLGIQ